MGARPPSFPPLLVGHKVTAQSDPMLRAVSRAAKGEFGAGDLVWADDPHWLRFALVLEPEVGREHCAEMLFAAMVAFGDALGALAPPEVAVTYGWPSLIYLNDASVGSADLRISETETDGIPDWLAVGLTIHHSPDGRGREAGYEPERTTLWDEGCGMISNIRLLEAVARHLVNAIHTWSEEGFADLHRHWWQRRNESRPLAENAVAGDPGRLIGLDENGNALVSGNGATVSVPVLDALERVRPS